MSQSSGSNSCPIDHTNPEIVSKYQHIGRQTEKQNVFKSALVSPTSSQIDQTKNLQPTCPVDHTNQETMAKFGYKPTKEARTLDHANGGEGLPPLPDVPANLSGEREISSIPRAGANENWVYPSEKQFYSAMKRKNFNPNAQDMPVIIPIHNAVNERCWQQILAWEYRQASKACGGPQLLKFEGDSSKLSPKARFNMLFGATRPFDRHDWTIDRCGKQIDYVIDFYAGEPDPRFPERQSFYLDARPKLNSWEGVKMRLQSFIWGP